MEQNTIFSPTMAGIFITADHRSGDQTKMTGDRGNFVLADQFDRQTQHWTFPSIYIYIHHINQLIGGKLLISRKLAWPISLIGNLYFVIDIPAWWIECDAFRNILLEQNTKCSPTMMDLLSYIL